MKTTGICWGLEAKRTKNEKPLSHSDNSVLLTPSPHYDYKDLAALRGPSDPRFQLERLERSRDKSRRVSWPNNPNTPFHLIQLAEQQDDCGLNSKQHQSGGYRKPKWQTAQGSPLATQRTWHQRRPLRPKPALNRDRYRSLLSVWPLNIF